MVYELSTPTVSAPRVRRLRRHKETLETKDYEMEVGNLKAHTVWSSRPIALSTPLALKWGSLYYTGSLLREAWPDDKPMKRSRADGMK